MNVGTSAGTAISAELIVNYFYGMVNQFFKILPMREADEPSLVTYMQSLQLELMGCHELIVGMRDNTAYLKLLSILQYLIDHEDCTVREVKREVFKCISLCNKLAAQYAKEAGLG